MFMIAVNSDNPNILNYETTIINKYASWDQELTERKTRLGKKKRNFSQIRHISEVY